MEGNRDYACLILSYLRLDDDNNYHKDYNNSNKYENNDSDIHNPNYSHSSTPTLTIRVFKDSRGEYSSCQGRVNCSNISLGLQEGS